MKKNSHIVICIILLAITIGTVCYFSEWTDPSQEETNTADSSPSRENHVSHGDASNPSQTRNGRRTRTKNREADHLRRELKNANVQLEKLSGPLNKEMFSSTVNVEIAAGETLVTGGYKRADGHHELTFMTPTTITLEDGSEGIRLTPRVLSIDPEFAKANGLGTLATNARNTLQHAEAWNQKELTSILRAASQHGDANIMAAPTMLSKPSMPVTLSMGDGYSIESTVERTATGGFAIKARIERTPLPNHHGKDQ